MKRIASHFALLPDGMLPRPVVTVADDGRITEVGQYGESGPDSMPGTEFRSGVLMPAAVNAHCHLELSFLKGAIPRGCGFAGFASAMAAVRGRFTDAQRLEAMEAADREMFDEGTGAAGDISNDDTSFAVKRRSPITYRTFAEVFGIDNPSCEAARALLTEPATSLTPHSLYSLNDDVLRRTAAEAEGSLSIHFMESPAEEELFRGRGPLLEWFRKAGFRYDFLHYDSPAERLAACIPAGKRLLLVHCTCVRQEDIDLIMNHFRAGVSWCLCPRSNDYISGAAPDVGLLRRNNLHICIGTDSLASNDSLSLAAEIRRFAGLPAAEVLQWATRNGAEALGLNDGTGRLEAGNRCGLVAAQGIDLREMTVTDRFEMHRIV